MNLKRVIPIITIIGNKMVKTKFFDNPIYIGDPINAIRIFNEKEVDEIVLIDIHSTKNNSSINLEIIKSISEECFMPITYGGGIKNLEDAKSIFSLGIEKIIIQKSAFTNPNFIKDLVTIYGSSSISVSIDINKISNQYFIYDYLTRNNTILDINQTIEKFIEYGVGEFCFNIVNLDGSLKGPDYFFISSFIERLQIPSIYVGGVSTLEEIRSLNNTKLSGVGIGSLFSLYGPHNAPLIRYFK